MRPPTETATDRFGASRGVRIEGFHALKHAIRFGAAIGRMVCADRSAALALARELAPDVLDALDDALEELGEGPFRALAGAKIPTRILAWAPRPEVDPASLWTSDDPRPCVALEQPRRPGNIGASVRVAAAADARGLLVWGALDPWSPAAIAGAAGLQFALPCARIETPPPARGPIVAFTPDGDPFEPIERGAILLFGGERSGLSPRALALADRRMALPMRRGVSSLNLATSVAAALYGAHFVSNTRKVPL